MSAPLTRQLACAQRTVERERRRLDRLIAQGKPVNKFAWQAELANMDSIVETLQKQVWLEEISNEIKADAEKITQATQL